jgi:hypothetical protein
MNTVVLCVDLMDRSRIAAARPDAVFVRTPAALLERVAAGEVDSVIVDLSRAGAIDAIAAVAAQGVAVTGYGAHVDAELLDAARSAGCTEVLPRSRFFTRLDRAGRPEPEEREQ